MTAGELRKEMEGVPDDLPIIIVSDNGVAADLRSVRTDDLFVTIET